MSQSMLILSPSLIERTLMKFLKNIEGKVLVSISFFPLYISEKALKIF